MLDEIEVPLHHGLLTAHPPQRAVITDQPVPSHLQGVTVLCQKSVSPFRLFEQIEEGFCLSRRFF